MSNAEVCRSSAARIDTDHPRDKLHRRDNLRVRVYLSNEGLRPNIIASALDMLACIPMTTIGNAYPEPQSQRPPPLQLIRQALPDTLRPELKWSVMPQLEGKGSSYRREAFTKYRAAQQGVPVEQQ
jgi:hypothetical protein